MASALAVQFCRVVAPEKLPDRLLVSGIFQQKETLLLKEQVMLTYLFEVTKPWFGNSKLLPSLVETLTAEHAKLDPAQPLDDQFELLLRSINQTLNTISEEGDTDWIGNLNGLILVMNSEELHFAQTGRCPAYLLQNNRIRQITDDPQNTPEPHPLRTFANLASGHLVEGDQLLIANQELYKEISLDALRRIINTSTPYASSQAIARELKREKNSAVTCIILKAETEAAATTGEPVEIILEEEMQSNVRKFGKRLAPFINKAKEVGAKAGAAGLEAARQTQQTVKEKVAPKAAELMKKGLENFKAEEKPSDPVLPTETTEATEVLPEATQPVVEIIPSRTKREREHLAAIASAAESRLTHEDEVAPEFVSVIPESERKIETKPSSTSENPALLFLTKTVPRILLAALVKAGLWLQIPRNKRMASLGAGVVLIILTIGFAIRAFHHSSAPAAVTEANSSSLNEVKDILSRLPKEISTGDTQTAGKDIVTAENDINGLQNASAAQLSQANTLWSSIITQADTLNKATRFSTPVATYQIGATAKGFITNLPYFYTWNNTSNLVRTGQGDPSQVQASIALPDPTDAIISATRTNETDTVGYILTRQNKVESIFQNGTGTLLKPITPESGSFAPGDVISTYNGNIYILDGKTGLLWKYANSGTTYAKGVSVIDINKYDIRNSSSFAIDGSIYFLKSDGIVTRFTSGKQDDFSLKDQPYQAAHLVQPAQIITDPTYPNIYVLDTGVTSGIHSTAAVYVYTKDGTYVGSYIFPDTLTKIRAFDVNPKSNKLWILNDTQLYEFNIQ